MPRAKKPASPPPTVCPACKGEGQVEDFILVGPRKNCSRIDTWAFCFDCNGTGQLTNTEGR